MDLSQLKTQVMTMFMMKSAQQPVQRFTAAGNQTLNGPPQLSQHSEIWSILYGMMVMNLVEYIFKHLPALMLVIQAWLFAQWKPKQKEWLPASLGKSDSEKEKIHSITLTRVFQKQTSDRETNVNVEKVDAVLDFICALDNAKHVRLDTRYTIGSTEDIQLTPDLKARVKQTTGGAVSTGAGDEISTFEIVVFSAVLKLTDIRAWIDDVHKNYVFEKNNKLGNNIYYFNEIPHEPTVIADMSGDTPKKTYRWDNMPKTLTFNMNEFKTSKSFTNVYGGHVDELKERLDLFVNHPEWYAERGIPHSLGIMLHGIPGAGKTSTIKAIAKDTHRHIFNLSLRPFTTQKQLLNLFFNETVVVHKYDGSKTTYNIPINRRVYVIEDIDCMTDVTLDRSLLAASANPSAVSTEGGDAVTLSFLLNLLDGVLETPGRILVITSNYPEKLDKALVRPGRIDVKIEFTNASREFIREMVARFYSEPSLSINEIPAELDNVFTPAEVMESLCTYFKSKEAALNHMLKKRIRQEPCLIVQDGQLPVPTRQENRAIQEIPTTATPTTATPTTATPTIDSPIESETTLEDTGTSLESLGISTSTAPKNELIVFDSKHELKNDQLFNMNAESRALEVMSYNYQNHPPKDLFYNGMKPNMDLIQTVPLMNMEQIQQYMIPDPDYVPDKSEISGFDANGANPSFWSDAQNIEHPILDEATAGAIIFSPPDRMDP
jgi:chaperone BCS1